MSLTKNITYEERTNLIQALHITQHIKSTEIPDYTFNSFNDWMQYIRRELDKYSGNRRYTVYRPSK